MDINRVPNRASDAGPESSTEMTWRDMLDCAEDAIRDTKRVYRDDPIEEKRLRMARIEAAIEELYSALTAVNRG